MEVINYIEYDYIDRPSFEHKVKEVLKEIYQTPFDIDTTFNNCMAFGYAVVHPVSNKYPKGMIMITDISRTVVTFLI